MAASHAHPPFVRAGSGRHPEIDDAALLEELGVHDDELWSLAGPRDLPAWLRLRARYGIDRTPPVPCDLFLWGRGEGPDPRMTRIGGVPWFPRTQPWPMAGGAPMAFVAQFNFEDSVDIVGETPAEVLLLFTADPARLQGVEPPRMQLVWVPARLDDPLDASSMPDRAPSVPFEAFGARLRTADHPKAWGLSHDIPEVVDESAWKLPTLWGTKIGGVPFTSRGNLMEAPDGYLCQLVTAEPAGSGPWPLVNEDEPAGAPDGLMIGRHGELVICASPDGRAFVDPSFS